MTAVTREIAWLQFPTEATWANVKRSVKPTQTGSTSGAPRSSFSRLEMPSLAGWRRDQVSERSWECSGEQTAEHTQGHSAIG